MLGIGFVGQTYSWHRLCLTKPIPGVCYVGQIYSWHRLCSTVMLKQNLFLAYIMLDKTTYGICCKNL